MKRIRLLQISIIAGVLAMFGGINCVITDDVDAATKSKPSVRRPSPDRKPTPYRSHGGKRR